MLAIRLSQDIEGRLQYLAHQTGRTKTFYVREAILAHLENLEDVYLADQRLSEIRSGEVDSISAKHLFDDLGV